MHVLLSTNKAPIFKQVRLTEEVPGLVSLMVSEIQSTQIET